MFRTLDDYYAGDLRRRCSPEADYGVHWRLTPWDYYWRVSYVRDTGEVYAVHQGSTIGPVFVLAIVKPDPVPDGDRRLLYYATLDAILDGWPEQCGRPDSLRWVRDRLDSYRPLVMLWDL